VVILDLQNLRIDTGGSSEGQRRRPTARFVEISSTDQTASLEQDIGERIAAIRLQRALISVGLIGHRSATSLISIGSCTADAAMRGGDTPPSETTGALDQRNFKLLVGRPVSFTSSEPGPIILAVEVPSVYACVDKDLADGLQIWADDLSQLVARTCGADGQSEPARSQDTSLIGSRFFAKARNRGSQSTSTTTTSLNTAVPSQSSGEVVVKVILAEGMPQVTAHILRIH
jgi:autophagy-related protein 2